MHRAVRYALVAIVSFFALFPIYWMVTTSLKLPREWTQFPPIWLPVPSLTNYQIIFSEPYSATRDEVAQITGQYAGFQTTPAATPAIINSLIIAGFATLLALIVGTLAAYALSRFRTGGRFLYLFILSVRMFPAVAVAVPLMIFFSGIGLIDSHFGLISIYLGVSVAYIVWMMKTFFDEVPVEIEEAAMLDGMRRHRILFSIVMPVVRGGLLASALFAFIINWGEFGFALIFTSNVATTTPVIITHYQLGGGYQYGLMAALSGVAVIPVVLFGYLIQRYMVRGMTFGALKGRR